VIIFQRAVRESKVDGESAGSVVEAELSVVQRSDIVQCNTTISCRFTNLSVGGAAVDVCGAARDTAETTGIVTSCATGDVALATERGRRTCPVTSDGVCAVDVTFVRGAR